MKLPQGSALASAAVTGTLTTADETSARFDELQRKLVPLWQSIQAMTQDEQTDRVPLF